MGAGSSLSVDCAVCVCIRMHVCVVWVTVWFFMCADVHMCVSSTHALPCTPFFCCLRELGTQALLSMAKKVELFPWPSTVIKVFNFS